MRASKRAHVREMMRGRRRVGLARSSFDQFRAWLRVGSMKKCDRRRAKCGAAISVHMHFSTCISEQSVHTDTFRHQSSIPTQLVQR